MAPKTTPETETERCAAPHPRAALDAAIEAARIASPVVTGPDGRHHVILADGYRIEIDPADTGGLHAVTQPEWLAMERG